jgi:hypothetical protein
LIRTFQSRLALAAAILVAAQAGMAQAEKTEGPMPEKASAKPDVGPAAIDGAKRDFETVKSLREFGADSKAPATRLAMPKLDTGPSAAPVLPRPIRPGTEKPGANWLVEAMEAREKANPGRAAEARTSSQGEAERREDKDGRKSADGDEPRLRGRVESVNPFAQYLGEWISPQDYALLKPALVPADVTEGVGPRGATGARPSEFATEGRDWSGLSRVGQAAADSRQSGPSRGRVNPYLEVPSEPSQLPTFLPAPPKPAMAPLVPPPTIVAPPPEPPPAVPRNKPVDFARPSPDEKYLKQLKRF